ncbi:S8 family serine peptidase [Paenibacillus montanisoli]|uniref:Peptidase S8 n=1 Tax=Paenibacillus montanisoli TaxID=2081970 RepID=A0A328TWE6_9BACL|nr:S8 family serine peptidase [Paenibacillus montanisoli]RAP73972.1 peptidase S8 [Paenibacillus montanisoli]
MMKNFMRYSINRIDYNRPSDATPEVPACGLASRACAGDGAAPAGGCAQPPVAPRSRRSRLARLALHAALAALLLWSAPAGAATAAAAGAAPAALPPAAAAGGPPIAAAAANPAAAGGHDEPAPTGGWLIKWRDPELAKPLPGTRVLRRLAMPGAAAVDVVRPEDPGADTSEWLLRLQRMPEIAYAEPISRVRLLAAEVQPNDPELPKQHHLDQIGAKAAWSKAHDQKALTIALIDTGVDLGHPDLKDNLVAGTNLVSPGKPPEDDNGHGTAVAGVLAGEGNNKAGIAGVLWHAKLMPIKALDQDGFGDEERLGKAILYAVDHGAKIIVLSVGLYRYSPYLRDIVQYAESKGALLVAASGNDGLALGAKAEVKYPAAYATVLAVSGADPDGQPEPRSNAGSEIDLAAPWHVYTTAPGGGYKHEEGTSMAAPQVAAAAALAWAVHPGYKPYQVRELLRQTARDIGKPGVDDASGYGLLQVDRVVTGLLKADGYEPNNTRQEARKFPLGKRIGAELAGGSDRDWYALDAPYDGVISIQLQSLTTPGTTTPILQMTHVAGGTVRGTKETKLGNQTIDWHVKKGRNEFELRFFDKTTKQRLSYLLTSTFEIAPDAYEINDKPYQAFTLKPQSQQLTGNFHQTGDRDWYAIHFETGGTLKLTLSTDSARIDPALAYQRQGEALHEIDENGEAESEVSEQIQVTPGLYYIRVHNGLSAQAGPSAAAYTLNLKLISKYTDPNEPNDKTYEATGVAPGSNYMGVIGANDADWYQLRTDSESVLSVQVSGIPSGIRMKAEVFDKRQKPLFTLQSARNQTRMAKEQRVQAGLYYVKVTANSSFDKQYYGLRIGAEPIVAGFRDIDGHWAEDAIASLSKSGIVKGSGNYRFHPDKSITRAEAVSMLVRAFEPVPIKGAGFSDVPATHWAYTAISEASGTGWIGGYPGGAFGPSRPITREEMASILLRVLRLNAGRPNASPFSDVETARWSSAAIQAMKRSGLLGGYPDGSFKPERTASRAEFAALLLRAVQM